MYEYFDKIERQNAANQALEQETDKIEDDKIQETLDWVMEEERKEAEAKKAEEEEKKRLQEQDDGWMIDQLKKQYGDSFGDDVNLDF
jgi:hypothetical protein